MLPSLLSKVQFLAGLSECISLCFEGLDLLIQLCHFVFEELASLFVIRTQPMNIGRFGVLIRVGQATATTRLGPNRTHGSFVKERLGGSLTLQTHSQLGPS